MRKVLLVLLFVVSVFANNDEEIGRPVIDWKQGQIESAVLSSDGKSFYTLQGKDLIHWSLSPLKKLEAWEIPLKKIKTGKKKNRFHDIWFLDNYTKVLIASIEGMMVYNLKTHKVEKKVAYRSHSLVVDGNLIYLTHPTSIKEGYKYNIDLEVWNASELKQIKSVNITEMGRKQIDICYDGEADNETQKSNCPIENLGNLVVGTNYLYYPTSHGKVLIINKNTLDFKKFGDFFYPGQGGNTMEIIKSNYLNTRRSLYRLTDDKLIYHADIGSTDNYIKEHNLKVVQSLHWDAKPKRFSVVGNLCLKTRNSASQLPYIFINLRMNKKDIDFVTQSNKEIVIKRHRKNIFESSSKNAKSLQMYTQDKQIVPMNDRTYNKYHTNFNIGVN